jgi:hypothetical protein
MRGVETRLDGTTEVVRIPMRFQCRGGRKRIVAPDGSQIVPTSQPRPDSTLIKALARAWRWQRTLDNGVYATISEISETEGINKSYVSRILRLALLAPEVVEDMLAGDGRSCAHAGAAQAAAAGELAGAARGYRPDAAVLTRLDGGPPTRACSCDRRRVRAPSAKGGRDGQANRARPVYAR